MRSTDFSKLVEASTGVLTDTTPHFQRTLDLVIAQMNGNQEQIDEKMIMFNQENVMVKLFFLLVVLVQVRGLPLKISWKVINSRLEMLMSGRRHLLPFPNSNEIQQTGKEL